MFTTEHFRCPSLRETISHLWLEKTRHARFLPYEFMPVEVYSLLLSQHLHFYLSESQNTYACADGMFEQERTTQYLQTPALERRIKQSSRDFGPCDRFWTQLALRCFLLPTLPPGTTLGESYVCP